MKTLRDYQYNAVGDIRSSLRETKRIVLSAPTGSGKTVIIADITNKALEKYSKVLITVPAIALVDQTVEALWEQGVTDVGVIQASHPMTDWGKPVQVASVQTLQNRWKEWKEGKGNMPDANIVLVDEVHRMFELFSNWMTDPAWLKIPFIGFSATPWSKGLGLLYSKLITANNINTLIESKVLVPFRTFAPDAPDLTGVRTLAGEFVQADLDEVMRPHKLVACIVETWKTLAIDRPTVCFCCSRAHADQVAKEFNAAGVGAGYLDCETPLDERKAVRNRMLDGAVKVVCNVDVVGLGVDWPEVSCIIYARPTMSDIRFVQNVGRGLRAAPGKEDLLILDHSTTTQRLGFVNEIYEYHPVLDDGKPKPKAEAVLLPKECPACHLLKPPRVAVCPHCGHDAKAHADPVKVERGTLREVQPGDDMEQLRKQLPEKRNVFGQLWWWADQKGYKKGYAAVKTKEIFGTFPRDRVPDPNTISEPVPELVNYLYLSTEKWKKEQNSARRRAKARETNGHMNGNGHAGEQSPIADEAPAYVGNTLMTADDVDDLEDFK